MYNVHCTVLITKNRQMNTQENKTKTLFELFYVKCQLMIICTHTLKYPFLNQCPLSLILIYVCSVQYAV